MNATTKTRKKVSKGFVFVACLAPLGWIAYLVLTGQAGANPIEAANRFLGDWALRFLILVLAITPIRKITGWNDLARFRRMIGLYAFAYAVFHVTSYVALDQFFDWTAIWADIVKRTYITVGMACLLMLLPLAITSTNGMIKRLGGKRWRNLHKLVYPAGIAACLHYFMMVKADIREPLIYAGVLALLLGYRALGKLNISRAAVPDSQPLR